MFLPLFDVHKYKLIYYYSNSRPRSKIENHKSILYEFMQFMQYCLRYCSILKPIKGIGKNPRELKACSVPKLNWQALDNSNI